MDDLTYFFLLIIRIAVGVKGDIVLLRCPV